ncbi:MAG: DUF4105 domain-containing protein [Desulfuromonadaceae bacterium]|nr:DUF4105 domain-containing protein [Desulfuromonadaceae bacterium]MDD2854876.1 DUF4105 domain-containing protein [Desulfuromonadaceae bacterium]
MKLKPPLIITLVFSFLFILSPVVFAYDQLYVDLLVDRALRNKIYEQRGWKVLLHYGNSLMGEERSKIDDVKFFISPVGRTDPVLELEATLRSFFEPDSIDGHSSLCKFPARYSWLEEQLDIDPAELPEVSCSERDKSLETVEAKSAVLVFPVGHINSPASMFGHSLIRIDGSSKSTLISYAVNYSAVNTDSNGLSYAYKGLTGMYKGYFSLMPYYDKVKEYNNLEHRDMWEYRLSLSEAEVKQMLYHIWELQNINSSYYFIDENCSYNLLFLIEVARPELHLTDKTGFFVAPSDTVRVVMDTGIVDEIKYRPSQGTKIRKIISLLDSETQKTAHDISFQSDEADILNQMAVSKIDKIKILDLAAGFVQFRYSRKEIEKSNYNRKYLKILNHRSSLGTAPEDLYAIEEPSRPDTGHGTTKISIAAGIHRNKLFGELNIQPVFHALLDPDEGYLPGAQIKFLDTSLRYDSGIDKYYLKTLHLIDIISISPRDSFFKPLSWKINTGFDRILFSDGNEHTIYRLNSGGGFSYTSPFGGLFYMLGEIDINIAPQFSDFVSIAPGFSVGLIEQLMKKTKLYLNFSSYWYVTGDKRALLKGSLGINQSLNKSNSISLESSQEHIGSLNVSEVSMRWNYYY